MARSTSPALLLSVAVMAWSGSSLFATEPEQKTAAAAQAETTATSPVMIEKKYDTAKSNIEVTDSAKPRVVSDRLAASLGAGMPKYSPPVKEEPKKAADFTEDASDADKPKNNIIRLPQVNVQADRPPIFRERDIFAKDQQTDLAMKKFAGLGMVPLAGMNRKVAYSMYLEDQRLKDMGEMDESQQLIRKTDPDGADSLKKETDKAFIRTDEWGGYTSGPK